jgi:GNAT superfamily N-acetyltransferase
MLHIHECKSCRGYIAVSPPTKNKVNDKVGIEAHPYKYAKCSCGGVVQINPYTTVNINGFNVGLVNTNILKKSTLVFLEELQFNYDNIKLEPLTCFTEQLPYISELNLLGDDYAILDILNAHELIDIDMPNTFNMYSITCDNIHLGIIGTETYTKDPSTTWISWTLIIPEFRSKGIGKVAFNKLATMLKEQGIDKICVDCESPDKNPKTINFYEKLNFNIVSTAKEYRIENKEYTRKFLMYDNDIVMKLDLK